MNFLTTPLSTPCGRCHSFTHDGTEAMNSGVSCPSHFKLDADLTRVLRRLTICSVMMLKDGETTPSLAKLPGARSQWFVCLRQGGPGLSSRLAGPGADTCASSPTRRDKPYLFYFNIFSCILATNIITIAEKGLQCPTPQVCVSSCPNEAWTVDSSQYTKTVGEVFPNGTFCQPGVPLDMKVLQSLQEELCPGFRLPSSPGEESHFLPRPQVLKYFYDPNKETRSREPSHMPPLWRK